MPAFKKSSLTPNPISKILATLILGLTIFHPISSYIQWTIVIFFTGLFFLNGLHKEGLRTLLIFAIISLLLRLRLIQSNNIVILSFLTLLGLYHMFYLPLTSGLFFVRTSDVSGIIAAMDRLRVPQSFSIPIGVMFRFFPSFREERKNIRIAMRVRGLNFKNPLAYLEYVSVPLLVISSNIADDIARAAESRAIGNPGKKTNYLPIRTRPIDLVFVLVVCLLTLGGMVYDRI